MKLKDVSTKLIIAKDAFSAGGRSHDRIDDLTRDNPTFSPWWLRNWYESFGDPERDPVILAEGDAPGGRLAGFLALTRRRTGPGRALRSINTATNGHNRYASVLVSPEAPPGTLEALLDAGAALGSWDLFRLMAMRMEDAAAAVAWAGRRGFRVDTAPDMAPLLVMPSGGPAAVPEPSRNTRSRERALSRIGRLTFEVAEADSGNLPAAHEAYLAAEYSSWKARGGHLIAEDPQVDRFYRALLEAPDPTIRVFIHFLKLDGAVVAGRLSVGRGSTLAALKATFDDRYRKYSPGVILEHKFLENAINQLKYKQVDFYTKLDHYLVFANRKVDLLDVYIWNRTARSYAARQSRIAAISIRSAIKR